MKKEAYDN